MAEAFLPTDQFSKRFRDLVNHPGALRVGSTVNMIDDYGKTESWIVDTFRADGAEEVFVQRINSEGSVRLLIPREVAGTLAQQRDRLTARARRRGARQAVETKRTKGIAVGNLEALRKARRAPRKPRRKRGAK